MSLNVAIQMDPVEAINIDTDTTFLMMMEAQARGHSLWVYAPDHLSLEDGRVFARGRPLNLQAVKGDHHRLGDYETRDLSELDVVLMRQDPPFDLAYITATHFLERIHPTTLVVNNPAQVRNAPEKLFVTEFAGVQPPTLVTTDAEAVYAFREKHGDMVLKPLYGGGGSGVVRLKPDDPNLDALLEMHALIDGEPVGAINRIPAEGQVRSNLARGGRAAAVELTTRDLELCGIIGPALKARGLLFVGIDVIGDYMTEINVTSPTGAQQLKRFGGADAGALLWDRIEAIRAAG